MHSFTAKIEIIGVNPYVLLPEKILGDLFQKFGKDKGQIPVKIEIDGVSFIQTLVKFAGEWRLYLNTPMRDSSKSIVGDQIAIAIDYDAAERITPMHPKLKIAIEEDAFAKLIFDSLSPSRQKEIMRYINQLKSEESVGRNVAKAISYLHGNEKFVGREIR